jgi:hypothetical protein
VNGSKRALVARSNLFRSQQSPVGKVCVHAVDYATPAGHFCGKSAVVS